MQLHHGDTEDTEKCKMAVNTILISFLISFLLSVLSVSPW